MNQPDPANDPVVVAAVTADTHTLLEEIIKVTVLAPRQPGNSIDVAGLMFPALDRIALQRGAHNAQVFGCLMLRAVHAIDQACATVVALSQAGGQPVEIDEVINAVLERTKPDPLLVVKDLQGVDALRQAQHIIDNATDPDA